MKERRSRTLAGSAAREERIIELKQEAAKFRTLREFRKQAYNDMQALVREGLYNDMKSFFNKMSGPKSNDNDDVLDFIIGDLYDNDFRSVTDYKYYRPEFYKFIEDEYLVDTLRLHIEAMKNDRIEEMNNNV